MKINDLRPQNPTDAQLRAVEYFKRDPLIHADMLSVLCFHPHELLYAGEDGVVIAQVFSPTDSLHYVSAVDHESAEKLIKLVPRPAAIIIRGEECFRAAREAGLSDERPCYQVVYQKDEPPKYEIDGIEVRLMDKRDVKLAASYYELYDAEEDFKEQIDEGTLFGAYEGDSLVGYAGVHGDGSLGMLEVLPEQRKRGIGMVLASFMLKNRIDNGRIPYAHVFCDNEPSLKLQVKLGFDVSVSKLSWMFDPWDENME